MSAAVWIFIKRNFAVRGAKRVLYAAIFALLVWQLHKFWGVWIENPNTSIFYVIHGPIHEVGHTVTGIVTSSETAVVLAGSVFQILTPILVAVYFVVRKDYPATSLCLGWLGFATAEMGIYMYDANIGALQLVTPFMDASDIEGDFTILFRKWGCLASGCRIGEITVHIGYAFVFAALIMIIGMLVLGFLPERPMPEDEG